MYPIKSIQSFSYDYVTVSNPRFEKFFDFFFEIRRPHSTEETSTDEEKFGFDI